jgi:hypothetical protein
MKLSARIPWRRSAIAIAAGSVTLAAVPTGVLSRPAHADATLTSAKGAAAAAPQCPTSALEVWIGLGAGSAAAGSNYYPLEFSNISGTTCTLYGYPGVSAVGSNGAQLGSAAGRNPAVTPQTVTLAPGATVHTVLQIADVYNYPTSTCRPAAAVGLRVYPPNQTASTAVPFTFEACSAAGPVYLQVEAVQPGVGIPGQL